MTDQEPNAGRKPTVLCILDGWGDRAEAADNAIVNAGAPVFNQLRARWPNGQLDASELHVGLPSGQMGNSEVGHMNIGSGRVVMQDLPKIDAAIEDGALARNPALVGFLNTVADAGGALHVMGLLSPGGVHAHQDHIAALVKIAEAHGLAVHVHAFLDGRDTPPQSAMGYITEFEENIGAGKIATVSGRFYAMDRDKRWERVARAFAAVAHGEGQAADTAAAAVDAAYAEDATDEFVPPSVIAGYAGMQPGDGLLMGNFRADRAREILQSFVDPAFDAFDRKTPPELSAVIGMVEYSADLSTRMGALFPAETLRNTLGAVIADHGLKQLRIAETEKYAHVTFFFNGGQEEPYDGEDRILVPSPKVETYDLKPEMSAVEVTDHLVRVIGEGLYDLIVVNFANTDMVGHTGDLAAAVKAVETVDACLGRLDAAVSAAGGALLITADHGNAEMMKDPETGQAHTAHTMNRVPAILCGVEGVQALGDGRLADLAPTILDVMGVAQPEEMTGVSLISAAGVRAA
ncbi:MAG: 2,3-bisphosphoglycerate-independent phosphoglycerate mutase [Alphaproteobacteria bacterium]|nr:2,3-bisphosphoglycerate-independent phosphoglycerate mutase [Alphaproteobacteria bacterium]